MEAHVEEYKGYKIRIMYDEDSIDPRKEFDHFGKMVCFHGRYLLGDKDHAFSSPEEFQHFINNEDGIISLPLYLYDHSGVTISTTPFSCPWDSGMVGYIYATRKDAIHEFGKKKLTKKVKDKAIRCLIAEVEEYDAYLTGQVYGYIVENEEEDHIDSCWGFFGDAGFKFALEEAKSMVDFLIEEDARVESCMHM